MGVVAESRDSLELIDNDDGTISVRGETARWFERHSELGSVSPPEFSTETRPTGDRLP